MSHRIVPIAVLLGVLHLAFSAPVRADSRKEQETWLLLRLLDEMLDTKDFQEANAFQAALGVIEDKLAARGKELPFQVELAAFKKGSTARSILDGELAVKIPSAPKRVSIGGMLRILLAQLDDVEATFLIRNGVVTIVPAMMATAKHLLQTRVTGAFSREPLEVVLHDLAYQTGISIGFDPRAGELAKTPITVSFRNDVTLEAALRMVTEMAELKLVMLAEGLFVTTPAHAEILEKERPGKGTR